MDHVEVKKTCRSCGADLTGKMRHKNSRGEYYCSECIKSKKDSSKRRFLNLTDKQWRLILVWTFLALLAAFVFWEFLDVMSQRHNGEP